MTLSLACMIKGAAPSAIHGSTTEGLTLRFFLRSFSTALPLHRKRNINAHDNPLAAIAFSRDGTILASASCEGIYLRLFTVENANFIYQFQIGKYATDVLALSFDADGDY